MNKAHFEAAFARGAKASIVLPDPQESNLGAALAPRANEFLETVGE